MRRGIWCPYFYYAPFPARGLVKIAHIAEISPSRRLAAGLLEAYMELLGIDDPTRVMSYFDCLRRNAIKGHSLKGNLHPVKDGLDKVSTD